MCKGVGILEGGFFSTGVVGSSSLMAACSMVVNSPLLAGLMFKTGIAGGGDLFLAGVLSKVEVLLDGKGSVVFILALGLMTGKPMV